MNIHEYSAKIKSVYEKGRRKAHFLYPKFYIVLVMILLASGAFGLGRLSIMENAHSPVRIINPEVFLGANAYSSKNDRQKVVVTDPIIVGSTETHIFYFVWCIGAQGIAETNRRYFKTIALAKNAGYQASRDCTGLR